jgi:hypothetical protein
MEMDDAHILKADPSMEIPVGCGQHRSNDAAFA